MAVLLEKGYSSPIPLNHARIGFDNVVTGVSADSSAAGFPAAAALNYQTFERWKPADSGSVITATFSATDIDYIGIAAHTLSVADSVTVEVNGPDGWATVDNFPMNESLASDFAAQEYLIYDPIPDNEATMLLIKRVQATGVRVTVTYSGTAPTIGNITAGIALVMHRPFYAGHAPAMLNDNTTRKPNISESGEWLGNSITRQGRTTTHNWENLPAPWYRRHFEPFVQHAKRNPFLIAWNPLQFPSDCLYAVATDDASPSNSGTRNFINVSLPVTAYSDGTTPQVESLKMVGFDDLFDFTRGSEATYFDASGVLQTAAVNEPRFTHDPVTGEPLGLLYKLDENLAGTVAESIEFAQSSYYNQSGGRFLVSGYFIAGQPIMTSEGNALRRADITGSQTTTIGHVAENFVYDLDFGAAAIKSVKYIPNTEDAVALNDFEFLDLALKEWPNAI